MIRLRIRSWSGVESDGILLQLRGQDMRIALPGKEDAVELRFRTDQWYSEDGDPVQVDIVPSATPHCRCASRLSSPSDSLTAPPSGLVN